MSRMASSKSLAITSIYLCLGSGIALADTNWYIGQVEANAVWDTTNTIFSNQIARGQPGGFEANQSANDDVMQWNPSGSTQYSKTNYYDNQDTNPGTSLGMKVYYDTLTSGGGSGERQVSWSYEGTYTMSESGDFAMAVNGSDFKRDLPSASLDLLEIRYEAYFNGVTKGSGQLEWSYTDPKPTGYSNVVMFENLVASDELSWNVWITIKGSNNQLGQMGDSLGGVMIGQGFLGSNTVVPGPLGAVSLAFVGLARRRRRRSVGD